MKCLIGLFNTLQVLYIMCLYQLSKYSFSTSIPCLQILFDASPECRLHLIPDSGTGVTQATLLRPYFSYPLIVFAQF